MTTLMLHLKWMILLCVLILLPTQNVVAGSFSEILKLMGISIAPSGVKNPGSIPQENLWLSKIDGVRVLETKPITQNRAYHSPLWIPGTNRILAIKENKLVQFDVTKNEETILYSLENTITLHGFDKRNSNSILILQDSRPAELSLTTGKITLLPYDKKDTEDRIALDRLRDDYQKNGYWEISVKREKIIDASRNMEEIDKIHILRNGKPEIVIDCPEGCAQPALSENGKLLVFVGP